MNKLDKIQEALEFYAHGSIGMKYCIERREDMDELGGCKKAKEALMELKELRERLDSQELSTDMQIAYNQALLNQAKNNRDATKAMEAAINVIKNK